MKLDETQQKIIDALKGNSMTISELAKATGVHRVTVSKHADILKANGVLECKPIGNARIYSLKENRSEQEKNDEDLESVVRKLVAKELYGRKIVSLEEANEVAGAELDYGSAAESGDDGRAN